MKWNRYTFKTTNDKVDILSALLADAGIEGVQIEDHVPLTDDDTKGMFIDILPDQGDDDGTAVISFYLDPSDPALEVRLKATREILDDFGDGASLEESETADVDWINNWKEFFHPLRVGSVLVKPTWEDVPEECKAKVIIDIDPGTAFGTGGHETTQLCMLQLEKHIEKLNYAHKGCELLDVGTGSGILGITGIRLGATHCVGTDLDDNAIEAVGENMKTNFIMPDEFEVFCGNIIDDVSVQNLVGYEKYDICVANILAPVIVALIGDEKWSIAKHIKHDGIFITSGIIDSKEADVKSAFEASPYFKILETKHLEEWVSFTAKRV